MTELKQVFQIGDRTFATKAEATAFLRRPKVEAALNTLTGNQTDLVNFLIENQDDIEGVFDIGTIQRVSKSERNKFTKALEHAASLNDSKLAILVENAAQIVSSFRWPKTSRMDDAQKLTAQTEALTALANGNEQVAAYILANREGIVAGYAAGVEKRAVNPTAVAGLAAYQARKRAEKEAAAAAAPATEVVAEAAVEAAAS